MARTCCPLFPIKCAATQLSLSKSQKKVLKKFRAFLLYDRRPGAGDEVEGVMEEGSGADEVYKKGEMVESALDLTDLPTTVSLPLTPPLKPESPPPKPVAAPPCPPAESSAPAPGQGADPAKPRPGKAKAQRKARREARKAASYEVQKDGKTESGREEVGEVKGVARSSDGGARSSGGGARSSDSGARSVAEWLGLGWGEAGEGGARHSFTQRLVPATEEDPVFRESFKESLKLYQSYQQVYTLLPSYSSYTYSSYPYSSYRRSTATPRTSAMPRSSSGSCAKVRWCRVEGSAPSTSTTYWTEGV